MLSHGRVLCARCAVWCKRTVTTSSEFADEVAKFNKLSEVWWKDDTDPLLLMNMVRVPLVSEVAGSVHTSSSSHSVLDVGCGGGYLAEELARHKFNVTAIDPSQDMIRIATEHAPRSTTLKYECKTLDDVSDQYDIVVASEVLEHVPCMESFVAQCSTRVKPGGGILFTTINRTFSSWLFALMLAENVAGIVPRGTHQYNKLVPPAALTGALADNGFTISSVVGLSFNPLTKQWSRTSNLSVNYAVTALNLSSLSPIGRDVNKGVKESRDS